MTSWQDMFYVGIWMRQREWGDHPRTGDWYEAFTIFYCHTKTRVNTSRCYSTEKDAKRGAAMLFRSYMKSIEKDLLGE